MKRSAVFMLVLFAAAADSRTTLFNRQTVPDMWHQTGRASPYQRTSFLVALKQQNLEQLDAVFWAVSDPKSAQYQQFKSADELNILVRSSEEHKAVVKGWLSAGLGAHPDTHVEERGDALAVRHATVADVEALFSTQLYSYTHEVNGHTIIRNFDAFSIPDTLTEAVEFVEGISDFPMHRASVIKAADIGDSYRVCVVPQSIASLYNYSETRSSPRAVQMPAEFQGDRSYRQQDLTAFYKLVNLSGQNISKTFGPFDGTNPDMEATLDTQYITAVGLGIDNWYWTSDAWMYTFANNLINNADGLPDVVSISWGWAESQQCTIAGDCDTLGVDSTQYVKRVNAEFQKLGAAGVTVFVSSGDSGANGRSDPYCNGTVLNPSFPASSPFVTAVGATQLSNATATFGFTDLPACQNFSCAVAGAEEAVSFAVAGFTSGGGFSNLSARPAYQQEAVERYLSSASAELPPALFFNASGRGFPDVAAIGHNFLVQLYAGEVPMIPVGGTSASTPVWGGIAARLIDFSLAATGKPLGFLNPLLYQMHAEHPAAFHDVTFGDNKCTEQGCASTCQGFTATAGWDPVTGLGTPNYLEIEKYLQGLLSIKQIIV